MYEPPHWTRLPQVKLAKPEPADAPAKPHTNPSIEDLAESIKTLNDGMRAMAEHLAGLTARVDDLVDYIRPIREASFLLTKEEILAGAQQMLRSELVVRPEFKDGVPVLSSAEAASIDTGPGGCANAIAEQDAKPTSSVIEGARQLRALYGGCDED